MEKQTYFKRTDNTLPVCLVQTEFQELEQMICAVLDGHFRISADETPSLLIFDGAGSVILSSPDRTMQEILERPFTADALINTAIRVSSNPTGVSFAADEKSCSAVLGDVSVKLTATEFRLYSAILKSGSEFTSAEDLSNTVWGKCDRNLCTVYISYLRRKLDSAFGDGALITARGKGYRLRDIK